MKRKTSAGTHIIQHGETALSFALMYSKRKTLTIRVQADRTVTVDAPTGTLLARVHEIVHKKADWIVRKQRELRDKGAPRQYVSGEMYRYLGGLIRLQVDSGVIKRTAFSDDVLTLTTPTPDDPEQIEREMRVWFQGQARRVFAERLAVCLPKTEALGIPAPQKLTIRLMKTRWGSCSGGGRVTLNLRLIQADTDLIDYVILHELCHLRELNHSKRFYDLMTHILPDWREQRRLVNQCEVMW